MEQERDLERVWRSGGEDARAMLDEAQLRLEQMLELARRAARDGCPPQERRRLQGELERLRAQLDRAADEYAFGPTGNRT